MLDVRAYSCELSPHGTIMAVHEESIPGFTLYDLMTGKAMAFGPRRGMFGLWLDATTWFEYQSDSWIDNTYQPTEGWLVDLSRGTVTDTMMLDPVQRDQVIRDVKTILRTYNARREAALVSPDGTYKADGGFIFEHTGPRNGQVKNHVDTSMFGNPPGPIRFLPVTP